jgi:hypothetical protein
LLSCVEACSTYRLRKNDRGLIEPRKEPARCVPYYHYFQHQRFGLCYVRIQSWFPFTVRIGLSSHEAKIDLRTRAEGTRLKFWYGTNSSKIYDKEAQALRIETTINDPKGFQVFRTKEGEAGDAPKSWQQMRKGVADLERRAEVSHAANQRLAESLASVAETTSLGKLVEPLCQPVLDKNGRRARALNPAAGPDGELLRCLADGEFLLNGFRNRDLRVKLHQATKDPQERRKQAAAITRKLALLKAHGLIVKVQKTHRYRLSAAGQRVTTALLTAYGADVNRLAAAA